MNFLFAYGLFLAKVVTVIIAIVVLLATIAAMKRHKQEGKAEHLKITSLNDHFEALSEQLNHELLDKKALKEKQKAQKKAEKNQENVADKRPRLFVMDFDGDIEASAVEDLREHINAVLQVAQSGDEVLLRLESGGGYVHAYGLAASQLVRLRDKSIRLVIAVDKIAASGGYMMACVADELVAAPFAIIGSVGVIGALPNFHDLLEKHHIHYEQHTAGAHKRSLTVFGENTEEDRMQFRKELAETHTLFKSHIQAMRPHLNVDAIATGETWYGQQAVENGLIDRIQTSDDYLLSHLNTHHMLLLENDVEETLFERLKSRFLGKVAAGKPFKSHIL